MGMGGHSTGGVPHAPIDLGGTKGKPNPFSASQSPTSLTMPKYGPVPAFISYASLCSEMQNEELEGFYLGLTECAAGVTCNLLTPWVHMLSASHGQEGLELGERPLTSLDRIGSSV